MKHKTQLPENEIILYALALAQTLGFTYASVMYESGDGSLFMMLLAGIRGLLLGAALSFGAAVTAQKAPRIASKRARQVGYWSLGGLLIVSPIVMAPAIASAMPLSVRDILAPWAQWLVAGSLAVAPDFVAVAVSAMSGTLQPQNNPDEQTSSEPKREEAKDIPASSVPVFACSTCQRIFGSQNALNAHEKAHKPILETLAQEVISGSTQ